MQVRKRWTKHLYCPTCGKTGQAEISEIDAPLLRGDVDRTVDHCPPGFRLTLGNMTSRQHQIVCVDCDTVVYGPKRITRPSRATPAATERAPGFD